MPVEEESLGKVTFDLSEYQGSVSLILDDLWGQPFDVELLDPLFDMLCSFI